MNKVSRTDSVQGDVMGTRIKDKNEVPWPHMCSCSSKVMVQDIRDRV